jgi:hypothetical protein
MLKLDMADIIKIFIISSADEVRNLDRHSSNPSYILEKEIYLTSAKLEGIPISFCVATSEFDWFFPSYKMRDGTSIFTFLDKLAVQQELRKEVLK